MLVSILWDSVLPTPKLTAKQAMFCVEYLVDLNASQASIRAGYSKKTSRAVGCENLTKPNVKKEIDRLKAIRIKKVELTSEKVLIDIERVRQKAEGSEQYNISLKASELQGKHLAMFTERVAHEGEIKWPEITISLDS